MRGKRAGIQTKVLGVLLPTIFIVIAGILFLIYTSTAKIVSAKSESLLRVSTESVINMVVAWMNTTVTALEQERDSIEYFDMTGEEELDYIKHTTGQYDSFPAGIYVATTEGQLLHASFVPGPEYDVFKKSWYVDGLKSEDFTMGSVYFDEDSQNYVVGISAVLKDKNQNVRGVAAADIYLDAISGIVQKIQLEQTGGTFLIDGWTNTIIGHKDPALVGAILDEQGELYQNVSGFIKAGQMGMQTCDGEDGKPAYINIVEIPDSRWIAVSYVPEAEVLSDVNILARTTIFIAVAALILLTILIILLIRATVVRPVKKIDHVARRIADGELDESIDYHSRDEFGMLALNFNKTVSRLRSYVEYINEISRVLNEIANGKLDFELTHDYVGEFYKIKDALNHISDSLNDTLGRINQAAEQVSSGSEQVSMGAQALSEGATEQASSIEELAATINEISQQIRTNAQHAEEASSQANNMGREMEESNQKMSRMVKAMGDIRNSSNEIGKIIKTIEDIAFQTNILALNAAVEAARAGAAGKGFAVVADEVRNLANKSSEASKDTARLIAGSLVAVEGGAEIADSTAKALMEAAEGAKTVTVTIDKISAASKEQADSILQVTQGIDQISSVVQTNSATSEESAAASEELSGQAQQLKELTGRFKLKS